MTAGTLVQVADSGKISFGRIGRVALVAGNVAYVRFADSDNLYIYNVEHLATLTSR